MSLTCFPLKSFALPVAMFLLLAACAHTATVPSGKSSVSATNALSVAGDVTNNQQGPSLTKPAEKIAYGGAVQALCSQKFNNCKQYKNCNQCGNCMYNCQIAGYNGNLRKCRKIYNKKGCA